VRDVCGVGFDECLSRARVVAVLQQFFGCAKQADVRIHVVISSLDCTGPRALRGRNTHQDTQLGAVGQPW
jgi:hypothetical protein